jgi:hypothetical protein
MPRKTIQTSAEEMEELAIQTITEIMSNSSYSPQDRLAAARDALKALGKNEPPKQQGNQIVLNFGAHLSSALLGVGRVGELMRPAADQETTDGN